MPRSFVHLLAEELEVEWSHLRLARELAEAKRGELSRHLAIDDAEDTTIVVFGSLARDEFTDGSDGILSTREQRDHLESLTYERLEGDALFGQSRNIGRRFQAALDRIFLEPGSPYYDLTLKYGVF